jgi:hydroxymethylglutaryl-CoA lyase
MSAPFRPGPASGTEAHHVTVVEVGPRDGLQNEAALVPTSAKVAYLERLMAAGVRRIEAVSFVHPGRVPQMADAEEVLAAVSRPAGVSLIGLVLNERGLDRALLAGVDEVNVVVVATETFSQKNQGMGRSESLRQTAEITRRALAANLSVSVTIGASFGCPFEGEVAPESVVEIARLCSDMGVHEIALADTIGVAVPSQVRNLVAAVRDVTDADLRCHLHNTRNTGYANAVAAVESGVVALDSSSGGIGGCPFAPRATGNIATEDLVYLLERSGWRTGLDFELLLEASRYVADRLDKDVPALLGRSGWFPDGHAPTR